MIPKTILRSSISLCLAAIGAAGWQAPTPETGQEAGGPALRIIVLEGEGGINIVKKKTAVKPVVEVRDRNNLPVAGLSVTFLAKKFGGASVSFNGSSSVTLTTDASGRASVGSMNPVGVGAVQITVTATYQAQTATTVISQTNALVAAGAAAGGISGGLIAAIAAGAGAAAVIALKVASNGNKTASTPPTAAIGASPGPGFGPPR
jgi:hypothetical protein